MIQWVSKIKTDGNGLPLTYFIPTQISVRKWCAAYTDKNLPSFMKSKIVYMIYNGQNRKVNGYKFMYLPTPAPR